MATFSDYYSNGGMDFESSYSRQHCENNGDNLMYDQPHSPQRPAAPAPRRQAYSTYGDGFDDDLGDYVPGSTVPSARSPYAPQPRQAVQAAYSDGFDDFDAGFGDGFDDFDAPPARQQAAPMQTAPTQRPQPAQRPAQRPAGPVYGPAPQQPMRARYGVYDDYSSETFEAEYGGLHAIGSSRKKNAAQQQPMQPQMQPMQPMNTGMGAPPAADDGYYGDATMVDRPFNAQVPSIFASYFDEQYMAAQASSRNQKNKVSTYQQRRRARLVSSFAAVFAIAAIVTTVALYFSLYHVSDPLNVKTAFSEMSSDTSLTMIKQSVDSTLSGQSIIVTVGGRSATFQFSRYGFEFAKEKDAADRFIEVTDQDGNVSSQTITTVGSLSFNETLVREFLYDVVGEEGVRMEEPSYDVNYETGVMAVKAGVNGYGIDYDLFISQLIERLSSSDFSNIECTMAETVAPPVNIDEIYEQVHCFVSDAVKTYDGSGQVVYVPDVVGVDFDLNTARSQIAAGGSEWNIALILTQPKLTLVELKAPDCPDLLATYTTLFNADNKARSNNLALAARYLTENGYLEPGEQLSFNDTVGERTPERGFNKATVYSSEGTDEDYGGGICQTSSTLYYTCILANLEIVQRKNHLYTVAYMTDTKGVQTFANDATVNWGTIDLVIANNREYPIRIEFVCTSGKITCNIYGTWNGITADLKYAENATERYKVIYRPAQPGKGNTAGQLGRVIQSYRVIYKDGVEIDRYREALSSYIPLNEVRYTNNLPAGREYYIEY